jgi:serine phosphatase RsbU (regulator of sigma subunit)
MLSIVGTSLLNQIIHEEFVWMPGEILTRLNYLFYRQLSLDMENIRDGMDAAVITVNLVNHSVYYSGAKLDAVCVKNNVLTDLKSHRVSIGEYKDSEFKTQTLAQDEQRTFYLFSDGMKDQHGGPDGKKLSMKRLREILIQASGLPMNEQKQFIYNTVNSWKAGYPQTDDMMLVSFKV